jgi:hypothetical protein
MKKLISLSIALALALTAMPQTVVLKLNLENGKEYKQVTTSKSTMELEVEGQKMKNVVTNVSAVLYLVKKVNPEDFDLEQRFLSARICSESPMGTMDCSSDKNDDKDQFSMVLKALINKPFEVKMDTLGEVLEVKGIEAVWDSAIDQMGTLPTMTKTQMKSMIMQALGPEALKNNSNLITDIFPDKPVSRGDKWTRTWSLQSLVKLQVITECELVDLTADYALIRGNSTLQTPANAAASEMMGIAVKYNIKGTMVSEIRIDLKSGWIIDGRIKQEFAGEASVGANPDMPDGMSLPVKGTNEITITDKQ